MRRLLAAASVTATLLTSPAFAGDAGKALFEQRCIACHQAGGVGAPGLAPPLSNPSLWKGLQDQAQHYFYSVLVSGLSGTLTVDGMGYYGLVMPTQADLSKDDMVALADYVLNDLNGLGVEPSTETAEMARANPLPHSQVMAIRKNAN